MIAEIQRLTEQYHAWLREKTDLRALDDWVEITTPFLDRHNDCLQIYARRADDGYLLTDDGATISDLELSGCRLDTPKRRGLLQLTLNGFGVRLQGKALQVRADRRDFALRKHNLLQAMLAINDMFYLATSVVASLFHEEVIAWLDDADIRYTPNVKFTGRTGYDHHYDFVIPKSKLQPERVLMSINRPDRASVQRLVFAWEDTRLVRAGAPRVYALMNDGERAVSRRERDALSEYEVRPVPWSEREDVRAELAG